MLLAGYDVWCGIFTPLKNFFNEINNVTHPLHDLNYQRFPLNNKQRGQLGRVMQFSS
jgi:hypothetical protein